MAIQKPSGQEEEYFARVESERRRKEAAGGFLSGMFRIFR